MITEKERSRVHLAMLRALNVPEANEDQNETDHRKAGLALAVSRYADGKPALVDIFAAADAIEIWLTGRDATFAIGNLHNVTGFDLQACETVMMLIGARQRGPLTWSIGDDPSPVELPEDILTNWARMNFLCG